MFHETITTRKINGGEISLNHIPVKQAIVFLQKRLGIGRVGDRGSI